MASSNALGSRYELQDPIGKGASGEVWRVWDHATSTVAAAKILWPHYATDPEVVTRFITERTILLGLQHPNIVRVTDLVMEGERLAIVMDLVPGPSLGRLLAAYGTAPASLAVPVIATVLDGLAYAHERGVIHRDIKSDNILVASERFAPNDIRIVDFGIAWLGEVGEQSGPEKVGTPLYMAPELFTVGSARAEADVYSTGIVLYELLAGRTPFAGGEDENAIALRHLQSAAPRLAVDERLWRVISAMLAKDPEDRPSAAQAAAALRSLPAATLPAFQLAPLPEPASWSRAADAEDGWEVPEPREEKKTAAAKRSAKEKPTAPVEAEDPNATGIRAAREFAPAVVADTSIEQDVGEVGGSTLLKADSHHSLRKLELPEEEAPRRKRWPFFLGGGVILAAGTAGVLWATGFFGGGEEPVPEPVAVTTLPSYTIGEVLPTGLRVDYEASYDSSAEATRLTVTYSALPSSALEGDVLLAIPGLDGDCPEVTSDEPNFSPTSASADGFDITCGYKLTDLELDAGRSLELTLDVDLALVDSEGEMPADYSAWLTQIENETSFGLSQITGTSFALQRVSGISVTAESVNMDSSGGMAVPYQVHAQWPGSDEGSPPTLLMSNETIAGMETELLMALTGGEGLSSVSVTTCNEAQISGIRVLAMQPTDSCTVQVQVGSIAAPEGRFAIQMRLSSDPSETASPEG